MRSELAGAHAALESASALAALVHNSRLLGGDHALVLRGGGNTSVKADGLDHTGRALRVLHVKGSGSDLASVKPGDFAPLRLAELLLLRNREVMSDAAMADYLLRCRLDPHAPRPSIETLLHAFLPAASVFHSHADAMLGLINTPQPVAVLREDHGGCGGVGRISVSG